jgi:hypothetical protein
MANFSRLYSYKGCCVKIFQFPFASFKLHLQRCLKIFGEHLLKEYGLARLLAQYGMASQFRFHTFSLMFVNPTEDTLIEKNVK